MARRAQAAEKKLHGAETRQGPVSPVSSFFRALAVLFLSKNPLHLLRKLAAAIETMLEAERDSRTRMPAA